MWWWDQLIEDRIEAAQAKGLFDNLRGQGKPLELEPGSGPEWLANHLLRQAGMLPDWLQLRKVIHEERPRVLATLREYEERAATLDPSDPGDRAILNRLEQRYVEAARQINQKIDEHNLRCPSLAHELSRFPEDAIARWRRRAARAQQR